MSERDMTSATTRRKEEELREELRVKAQEQILLNGLQKAHEYIVKHSRNRREIDWSSDLANRYRADAMALTEITDHLVWQLVLFHTGVEVLNILEGDGTRTLYLATSSMDAKVNLRVLVENPVGRTTGEIILGRSFMVADKWWRTEGGQE